MNKEQLENKIWYRALKVLFFTVFALVLIISSYITFGINRSTTKDFVKCALGGEFENPFSRFDFYRQEQNDIDLAVRCYELNSSSDVSLPNIGATSVQLQQVEMAKQELSKRYTKYDKIMQTPIRGVAFLLISIVIVCLAFWFVARIFSYIILGEKLFMLKRRTYN